MAWVRVSWGGAWLCYGYAFPLFEFPFVSSGLSFSFSFINIPLRLYHIISPLFVIPLAFSFPSSSSPFYLFLSKAPETVFRM